jgi:hypothetical protein
MRVMQVSVDQAKLENLSLKTESEEKRKENEKRKKRE